jgi:hypothetical protein
MARIGSSHSHYTNGGRETIIPNASENLKILDQY